MDYSFEHKTPVKGQNLYRLKMIDTDETFAFSRILSVLVDVDLTLTVYPNPVSNRVMISNYEQVKQVSVYNGLGTKILESQKLSPDGIDVTRLQQGICTIRLVLFDGTVSTQKILITR
jgi:hypothetical protein